MAASTSIIFRCVRAWPGANVQGRQVLVHYRCLCSFYSEITILTEMSIFLFQFQPENDVQETTQPTKSQQSQPTITEAVGRQTKYERNSNEARRLDRSVAEFICIDQLPVYIVEKNGFQQMLHKFNPRYQLPSRNYFMYTEIPKIYSETRDLITQYIKEKPFYACTTDLWTSRAADTFMSITMQYITQSWELHSWCLGCSGLNSDHTGDSLREAFDEVVTEEWKLDIAKLAGITTDNASNNQKAFKDDYTWIPCFGHNLNLAVNKAINIDRVSTALSRLRRTISAFTR